MHHHKMGGKCHGGGHHHNKHNCECGHGNGWRKFKTHQEKIKDLENYKRELEAELQAVNEILEHLENN